MFPLKKLFILITILFLITLPVKGENISIEATVDKNIITLDETFNLTIILRGGAELSVSNKINMPKLDNFDILSSTSYMDSKFSFSTSEMEVIKTLQYVLQPLKSGEFVIDSIEFHSNGKIIKANPIKITVTNTTKPTVSVPTFVPPGAYQIPSPSTYNNNDYWCVQEVDKDNVYVNEQVTLTFKFYYRNRLYQEAHYQPPDTTGFIVTKLTQSNVPSIEKMQNVKYYVDYVKHALFPIFSGKKTIGTTILNVPGGFFDYSTLKSNEVNIEVKPLPSEGRPSNFSGTVGDFVIYVKSDKDKVEINQPVSIEITVEGWGNVDAIGEPVLPHLSDFKSYPSGTSTDSFVKEDMVYSQKKFKYVIMPVKTGLLEFPEISYSYFAPREGKYKNISTKPLNIAVSEGTGNISSSSNTQEEIKITGQDINHIKTGSYVLKSDTSLLYKNIFLRFCIFFPPLGLCFSFYYKKYNDRLNSDIGFARFRRAYRKAMINLNKAKNIMKEKGNSEEFYSFLSRALTEYIGDKVNLPPAGLTLTDMFFILEEKQVDKEILELFRRTYESCEYGRFAPGGSGEENMRHALEMTEKIIVKLEKYM